MKKEVVTLKKLAQILDLSTSTISRALNDHPDISEVTIKKVKHLAQSMNYVPNIFAKGFRKHKTNIIGVVVPNITHYFTTTIVRGILEEAAIKGYRVIISESNNDVIKQTEMLNTMIQFGVDGILASLTKMTRDVDSVLQTLNTSPLILFDKVSSKIPCTQITINDEEAAYSAIEHLINIGKKRIAIIKEREFSYNSEKRYAGYLRALKDHNIDVDKKIIISVDDISLQQGKRMANHLLSMKKKPDAIFAITDSAAVGVIKTLKKFNIKIPDEMAVVGYSNSRLSTVIEPNLTTVNQPGETIGKNAVKYLIEEIESNADTITNKMIEIKGTLIIRDSTFKSLK
ncbi:LacI family DNA-binding transcriptional regulator [Flavivirga amylovorans]|uniref:LacI family DNA-binding transcriptional regulator n=1 Tax=Flavivirga amylovorans TaxID=870486 RepID=A0ABT8WZ36_9FLAO|nr:LacI family DNA-binding transcriptional regulator [Flavivirga amylovorans]MDO5986938.1 LacI family DNA-binding transcriptional regulator [Flavivirga amylovorans]